MEMEEEIIRRARGFFVACDDPRLPEIERRFMDDRRPYGQWPPALEAVGDRDEDGSIVDYDWVPNRAPRLPDVVVDRALVQAFRGRTSWETYAARQRYGCPLLAERDGFDPWPAPHSTPIADLIAAAREIAARNPWGFESRLDQMLRNDLGGYR